MMLGCPNKVPKACHVKVYKTSSYCWKPTNQLDCDEMCGVGSAPGRSRGSPLGEELGKLPTSGDGKVGKNGLAWLVLGSLK